MKVDRQIKKLRKIQTKIEYHNPCCLAFAYRRGNSNVTTNIGDAPGPSV
jgi:hypothetical protein